MTGDKRYDNVDEVRRAVTVLIRRFEVFTGAGRRRRFSTGAKLNLIAQVNECHDISELARRHDLRPLPLLT